jgi:hypothetical protein
MKERIKRTNTLRESMNATIRRKNGVEYLFFTRWYGFGKRTLPRWRVSKQYVGCTKHPPPSHLEANRYGSAKFTER